MVSLQVVRAGGTVLTVTGNGYGKRTALDEYRIQSRGGKGLIDIKTSDRNGPVVGVELPAGRRAGDADHRKGYDHPAEHGGDLHDRPQHPGGPPDPARRGRPPRLDRPPGRSRRRRRRAWGTRRAGVPERPRRIHEGARNEHLAVALGLAVAGLACSSPEKNVVNQYFGALKANDQTLTSFAMVAFDQKVDDFSIVAVGPETKTPATLPDLVKKAARSSRSSRRRTRRNTGPGATTSPCTPSSTRCARRRAKGGKMPADLQAGRGQVRAVPGEGPRAQEGRRGRRRPSSARSATSRCPSARPRTSRRSPARCCRRTST